MKKYVAAAVAVLAFAIATSVALASHQAATVTASGENYLIAGQASLGKGHVATIKVLSNGHVVAPEMRYQAPTAANHAWWVLTKQSELPHGNYVVELVNVVGSKHTNLKFPFSTP